MLKTIHTILYTLLVVLASMTTTIIGCSTEAPEETEEYNGLMFASSGKTEFVFIVGDNVHIEPEMTGGVTIKTADGTIARKGAVDSADKKKLKAGVKYLAVAKTPKEGKATHVYFQTLQIKVE